LQFDGTASGCQDIESCKVAIQWNLAECTILQLVEDLQHV
jgi:hypothetical protein